MPKFKPGNLVTRRGHPAGVALILGTGNNTYTYMYMSNRILGFTFYYKLMCHRDEFERCYEEWTEQTS